MEAAASNSKRLKSRSEIIHVALFYAMRTQLKAPKALDEMGLPFAVSFGIRFPMYGENLLRLPYAIKTQSPVLAVFMS